MAIIAQKVYQKCKLWLLFAACWGVIQACSKEHNTNSKKVLREWTEIKNEVETYCKVDSSKAFLLLRQFHHQHPNSNVAEAIYQLGVAETYKYWYQNSLATQHAQRALEISKSVEYVEGQIQAYLLISETNTKCDECLDYLLQIEELLRKDSNNVSSFLKFRFYYDMGFYYFEINDYRTAKKHFLESIEIAKKGTMKNEESFALLALSSAYNREEKFIESVDFAQKSIKVCESSDPKECGNHYYQLATSLLELGKYNEALDAILKASQLYKNHPHPFNSGEVLGILGSIYLKQKNYKEAEKSYLIFLDKARFPSTKIWAYSLLTSFYFKIGDFKNAYLNSKKYIQMRDSIYSNERTYSSVAKQTNFELAQKDEEVKEANIRFWYALEAALLILIAGGGLSFLLYRNNKLKRQLTVLEQEKLQQQIDFEQRKLATTTLHLSQQSDLLRNLKKEIEQLNDGADTGLRAKVKSILRTIENNVNDEDEWNNFKLHFEAVSPHFFETLRQRSSILTELDLKHCAYLKINLSPKQVAQILGISPKSVTLSRVRIKKKLQLNEEESLSTFLQSI